MNAPGHAARHPPKPRLALSVGVVGHRPNRLPKDKAGLDKLTANIGAALKAVAEGTRQAHARYRGYFDGGPDLTIVSALAEGVDRMAVHAAFALGYTLDAPLPFSQDVYEGDFPDAVAEFHDLLKHPRTRSVLSLPGRKTAGLTSGQRDPEAERAYESVGLTVLGQSDVVLMVWDGKASAGRGGTTEMIQTAIRAGLPIIYVDANAQTETKILWEGVTLTSSAAEVIDEIPAKRMDELGAIIDILVRPPEDAEERKNLNGYFEEKSHHRLMRPEFPLLMCAARVRAFRRTDTRAPDPDKLATEFAATANTITTSEKISTLAQAYGWSDALGVYFAQTFRGAFIMSFAFGALAVVIAALSLFAPDWKPLFVFIELIFIVAVLVNTYYAKKRDWQRRWVEPREIAERLRVTLPLWALGTRPNSFSGEEPSWTGWYVRALVRQQGLRSGPLFENFDAAKKMLEDLLIGQCSYHKEITAPRMAGLHRRLERSGGWLFAGTFVVAVVYLVFFAVWWLTKRDLPQFTDEHIKHLVAAISAALPAIATACYGIRVTGDFEGIALRSERTHAALDKLIAQIKRDPPDLNILRTRARAAADAMLGDVSSWRLAAESRSLTL